MGKVKQKKMVESEEVLRTLLGGDVVRLGCRARAKLVLREQFGGDLALYSEWLVAGTIEEVEGKL